MYVTKLLLPLVVSMFAFVFTAQYFHIGEVWGFIGGFAIGYTSLFVGLFWANS